MNFNEVKFNSIKWNTKANGGAFMMVKKTKIGKCYARKCSHK